MMKFTNHIRGLQARFLLLCVALVSFAASAMAESKLSVADVSAIAGQDFTMEIKLVNNDKISGLQADFRLPEHVTYSDFVLNQEVLPSEYFSVYVTNQDPHQDPASRNWRITVFPNEPLISILPGTVSLMTLTLHCDNYYSQKEDHIYFDNIFFTDEHANQFEQGKIDVPVSTYVGSVAAGETEIAVNTAKPYKVDVYMNNLIDINGVQGTIILPEGLSFKTNDYGKPAFIKGSRLPKNASVKFNEANGNFVINDMAGTENFGREGVLFSFEVIAATTLPEASKIEIKNFVVSKVMPGSGENPSFEIQEGIEIKVTHATLVAYNKTVTDLAALQTALDEAVAAIAEQAPDVKDSEAVTKAVSDVQNKLNTLKENVDKAFTEATFDDSFEAITTSMEEITTGIEAAKTLAITNQGAFVANKDQYGKDTLLIDEVEKALAVVVAKYDAALVEKFAEDSIAIAKAIETMDATAKASYENGTSVADAEALAAKVAEAKASVEALDAKLQGAKEAIEANKDQYGKDTLQINEVKTLLASTNETIATYDESVQEAMAEAKAAADAAIAAAETAITASFEAGTAVADKEANAALIEAAKEAVNKLAADAKAAQDKFLADEAAAAEAAQYEANQAAVTELRALLKEAETAAKAAEYECADEVYEIKDDISVLRSMIETIHANNNSVATAAEVEAMVESIKAKIAAVKQGADDKAAADANEAQYKKDTLMVNDLEKSLETVTWNFNAEVVEIYGEEIAAIQDAIAALKATAKASYDNATSVADAEAFAAEAEKVKGLIEALDNSITTGISDINGEKSNDVMYDLSGRRVIKAKGMVIKNGKKYFVK